MKVDLTELKKIVLVEGEGIGTLYEYYQKLKLLKILCKNKVIKKVLIYGLPEKYGFSLDIAYFMKMNKIKSFDVLDERKNKLEEYGQILKKINYPSPNNFIHQELGKKIITKYDLIISSEVMQRLNENKSYVKNLNNSKNWVVFAPNKNNKFHSAISKLKGIAENELKTSSSRTGFIDTPIFPPGISFKKNVREKFPIFPIYFMSIIEKTMPEFIKRRMAHIIYFKSENI